MIWKKIPTFISKDLCGSYNSLRPVDDLYKDWNAKWLSNISSCLIFSHISHIPGLNSGQVGFVLTTAMSMLCLFQWAVRMSVDIEDQMTSVERLLQYTQLPPEAPLTSTPEANPRPDWPQNGVISMQSAQLKYSIDSPIVLDDITFDTGPREKVRQNLKRISHLKNKMP